jgi:hypothetical protein
MRALVVAAVLLFAAVGASYAQSTPRTETCADDDAFCSLATPTPGIEVAGVQASPDDAQLPGETEPFIINDGFGD